MKVSIEEFETLLKEKNLTKRDFANYSKIPYNTVAGWKKYKYVPAYAMQILKDMPTNKNFVTAQELLNAGMPRAILWNNDPYKKVPI